MSVEAKESGSPPADDWRALELRSAATMPAAAVLSLLACSEEGLSTAETQHLLPLVGPNAL